MIYNPLLMCCTAHLHMVATVLQWAPLLPDLTLPQGLQSAVAPGFTHTHTHTPPLTPPLSHSQSSHSLSLSLLPLNPFHLTQAPQFFLPHTEGLPWLFVSGLGSFQCNTVVCRLKVLSSVGSDICVCVCVVVH